jgi:hypothetical protein
VDQAALTSSRRHKGHLIDPVSAWGTLVEIMPEKIR